jgi:outer membrane protein assembly factor BamA
MWKKYYGIAILCLFYGIASNAQPSVPDSSAFPTTENKARSEAFFIVGEIVITGNKHTKDYIVTRELPFKTGDSVQLPELVKQFEIAREQLINTHLFLEAVVAVKSIRGYIVDVAIDIKERWYIFPIPYIKPVDRNLAEWAKQGYGADRLNYGFKFIHYNMSGRNDKLRLWLITGYSKQLQFQYDQPYADKTLKHGYRVGLAYADNKEINYATINNQQQFTDTLSGFKTWSGYIEYDYRPGLRTFHALRLSYTRLNMDKDVLKLNPKYYKNGVNKIDLPEISYTLKYYNVDYIPYPLKGWMGEVSLLKRGIHPYTEMWQLSARYNKAMDLGKKWSVNWEGQGILKVPFDQPFYNSSMFGYHDFYLRGLEKYVIDGVAGFLARQTIRKELLRFNVPTFISSTTHDRIPFTIYAKAFTDMGYSHNKSFPENSLTNKMLYTTGFGIDVVTFYDFVFRFDYSFNQLGQNGLFLHFKNEF